MKRIIFLLGLLSLVGNTLADPINDDKPFAEKHVLLQVSDNDPAKFSLALDIANNLIRHYGSTDNIGDNETPASAGTVEVY